MRNDNVQDMKERSEKNKILYTKLMCFLCIFIIISNVINLCSNMYEYKKEQKMEQEKLMLVEQKNSQVRLITEVNENIFTTDIDNLEFEPGIRIPLPNDIIDEENIISCKKLVESNEIAHKSYVVKIDYNTANEVTRMILDIFKDRLKRDHGYEQTYKYFEDGTRIFVRDENEGYFSYMIFRGGEVTYGVCYGEPKLETF